GSNMKKRMIAMFLALVFMMTSLTALAYTQQEKTADALNELDLFRGTDKGYELNKNLTRAEGATLLVRVLGKEQAAKNWPVNIPFKDVPLWAVGYVGYAHQSGITNGTSATTFSPNDKLSDFMFLTLVLRTLGYTDQGAQPQFVWNNPYALAQQVGLIAKAEADSDFTRGDAVLILWNAMGTKLTGKNMTLAESLISEGVFTKAEFKKAEDIQKNGRKESAGVPVVRDEETNTNTNTNTGNTSDSSKMTYEKYNAMTAAEQQAYFNTYKNPSDFFAWYNAAKAEYEASQERIEIGAGGTIDLGELIKP
ncbi:MAG: S-layer homology domain-containing protein, partial [Clostridia bacterium]|nr:S-layer homology domain-containing protein [Clostridia bacterium]